MSKLKLYSWNVNGLRAISKKPEWQDWFANNDADIIALQEIKASVDQLEPDLVHVQGYYSYFQSSVVKKGYSGVAVYSKIEPIQVNYELPNLELQGEGRLLHLEFQEFHFLNIYFPNGGDENKRVPFKLNFYDAFIDYVQELRKTKPIVFCGDVNTAHQEIDLARPKSNEKTTGFLPEERAYLDRFVALGYVDTFRYLYPELRDRYTWWSYRMQARVKNVGWRIDYFFVSKELEKNIIEASIEDHQLGSDHCPIALSLEI